MAELPDNVRESFEAPKFWALATINPDGSPQSTTVWAHARDGKIIVNTALGRKKPRNLESEPRVALSTHWHDDAGYHSVSIQGRVVDTRSPATRRRKTSTTWPRSTSASRRTRGVHRASSVSLT